jgi:hypothetical protein
MVHLIGQTFKTTIYDSVIGKLVIENEILSDGSVSTSMWVIYPDGVGEEVFSIAEACERLEWGNMRYKIVTADRCFTEACYDDWGEMIKHWKEEILAGTHRIWVFGP